MTKLEKFRTRWNRWLGQKCRKDKPYWTTLLNSNWRGWATKVFVKNDLKSCYLVEAGIVLSVPHNREDIKGYFKLAIQYADMKDLYALDNLYCIDKMRD